jgi:hypothetical protein
MFEQKLKKFVNALTNAFNDRIMRPYDGFLSKKVSTINSAKTTFGYNEAQIKVINDIENLKKEVDTTAISQYNYFTFEDKIKEIRWRAELAFPDDGKYPRVSRLFKINPVNSSGKSIFKGISVPSKWSEAIPINFNPEEEVNKSKEKNVLGGKRKTYKRKLTKRKLSKRKTLRRHRS